MDGKTKSESKVEEHNTEQAMNHSDIPLQLSVEELKMKKMQIKFIIFVD